MEQTSWIRSSKAVKAELQIETEEDLDPNDASTKLSDLIDANTETSSTTSGEGAPQKKSLTQYAVNFFFKCQIIFLVFSLKNYTVYFHLKNFFRSQLFPYLVLYLLHSWTCKYFYLSQICIETEVTSLFIV